MNRMAENPRKSHVGVICSLFLTIVVTLNWLASWIGNVASDNLNTSKNEAPADIRPNTTGTYRAMVADLWVDAGNGDDGNNGRSPATAFRTIQRAADMAGPGTTVHILPGVYRESVQPAASGTANERILYLAEGGPGTVVIRGSEPASSLGWTQLEANTIGLPPGVDPTDIYYANLSDWGLKSPPRFVVELDGNGEVTNRLPLAREPDWKVVTEWKQHEYWWAADGGSDVASCDPSTDPNPQNCDSSFRSARQLTDRTNDVEPVGVEKGNLTTLGDLTGATLVALDTVQGHWVCYSLIVAHDVPAGRVTVDQPCGGGLGWGSKYQVEGAPYLLDTPGEWWFDVSNGLLYLWPRTAGNPVQSNLEISSRDNGFLMDNRSYISLNGLTIEFFNNNAVRLSNNFSDKSYYDTVRNTTLRYANHGLWLHQVVRADSPAENMINGFTLEDSEIGHMDTYAILHRSWWEDNAAADSFTRPGIANTTIRRNEMHHLGFRADQTNGNGVDIYFAHRLRFEDNYVHDVAHNGVQFLRSIIQSPKEYGFDPSEIKIGEILIKDNIFERACQLTADCGGLKIWGGPPDTHVFRDLLISGNVFRDNIGWAYVSEKRGKWWSGGPESDVQGMGGFGLYVDFASGIHAYRNIAYNNAHNGFMFSGTWRDGDMVYFNNVAANSLYGFLLGGQIQDSHGNFNTQLVNNIVVNNEGYGVLLDAASDDYGNLSMDHNLYFSNGWRALEDGGLLEAGAMAINEGSDLTDYFQTLEDIQTNTNWEGHGVEGNPHFWDYDVDDHDLFDGSWPNFHFTAASENALDKGTTLLPDSLVKLLEDFDVTDFRRGDAFDIGRYEGGFTLLINPSTQFISPGGVARYELSLYPSDLPYPVTLEVTSPSPDLTTTLSSPTLTADSTVTLTVTNKQMDLSLPAQFYTVSLTATGGGFMAVSSVNLVVNGTPIYLPMFYGMIEATKSS